MNAPLAPLLGRLVAPPNDGPFDAVRLSMVDRLVAAHAGGALDGPTWVRIWEEAITAMRDSVIAEATVAMRCAALRSRYPARQLARVLPDDASAAALRQRLLAEGIALERLERDGDALATMRQRGAALEAGWDAAVRIARLEARRRATDAERVFAWRRSWRPVVIVGSVLVALAVVTAAMIGGMIPAPEWFRPVVDWFWGLPWP